MTRRLSGVVLSGLMVILLLIPVEGANGESGDAGSAGSYLRVGVGARALGMGGVFTAIADDAYAAYWNPAGLAQLQSHEIGSMFGLMSLERKHNFLCYAFPFAGSWALAANWINFGVDEIERRDGEGVLDGTFDDVENSFGLSIAKGLTETFFLGTSFKFLTHKLEEQSATGFGFDFGALLKPRDQISFGFNLQDVGSSLKWNGRSKHKDSFPLNLRGGVALELLGEKLILGVDLEKNSSQAAELHGGAEYWLVEALAARAGYDDEQLTAGCSFGISNFRLDYAFSTDQLEEGSTHRISLLISFAGK